MEELRHLAVPELLRRIRAARAAGEPWRAGRETEALIARSLPRVRNVVAGFRLPEHPAVAIRPDDREDVAESWSALLPRLRERHGLSLDALAGAVSERLGLAGGRHAKARAYLEELEHDRLVPERLSRRLLDALAAVLGTPATWLERAGAVPTASAGALYRRHGEGAAEQRLEVIADAMLAGAADWDEVDELFQGGR